jgi:hypothetical protein
MVDFANIYAASNSFAARRWASPDKADCVSAVVLSRSKSADQGTQGGSQDADDGTAADERRVNPRTGRGQREQRIGRGSKHAFDGAEFSGIS